MDDHDDIVNDDDSTPPDTVFPVITINGNNPITFFEILTASYFYKAAQYPDNINLVEAGLFHRFDATNILKENLNRITINGVKRKK